jgi:predicted HicB family RNase H-like nuclease
MVAKKRIGRPPKAKEDRKAVNFTFRSRGRMRERLQRAAIASGRSISEEIESRLERLFQREEIEKLTEAVKLQVTLSERLWRLLEQAAKNHGWSMNTEIVDRLDVSFQVQIRKEMTMKSALEGVEAARLFEEGLSHPPADKEEKSK